MLKKNLLFLVIASILLSFLSAEVLELDSLVAISFSDEFTQTQINNYLLFKEKWEWLSYLVIPVFLILKISIIASFLDLGCFLTEYKIKYKKLFNIVVRAEFLFLGVIVLKTARFYFFQTNYTLEDFQYYHPFSLLNIIGHEGLEPWYVYPLQIINLFEMAYWIFLAYSLDKALEIPKGEHTGIKIVVSSYGVGLVIWVIAVMFLTLNMS